MGESLQSLRRARAELRGPRVALAEELASVIRAVFDDMRATGVPPDDGDRARARRLLRDELRYGGEAEEMVAVVRTVFGAMRAIGAPPSKRDRARARRLIGARSQVYA
jgi:hypothetical protein